MYPFKNMKNIAGRDDKKLSFILILVRKPRNISKESPPDDISRIRLTNKPTNNPRAPSISNIIMKRPRCFKLNRSNSFFICGDMKYEIEYAIKERLENKVQKINK
jgi:hypothetical protein